MPLTEKEIYRITAILDKDYTLVKQLHLCESDNIELHDKEAGRCRFCGRCVPDVTFDKVAHAISHMLGNDKLTSTYECDECNGRFAEMETQYAQYFGAYHTIMGIIGKKDIPKYQCKDLLIENSGSLVGLKIKESDDELFVIDEEKKTVKINLTRTYVPSDVLKTITKIALTVLPENYMCEFDEAIKWLNAEKNKPGGYKLMKYPTVIKYYYKQFPFISTVIFRRKDESMNDVPGYLFCLAYAGIFIFMPLTGCCLDERLAGKTCTIPVMPNPLDEECDTFRIESVDFFSNEKISKEKFSLLWNYSSKEENNIDPTV